MRKAAARIAPQTLEDEAASERLRKEAEEEQRTISGICDTQGLEIHEVRCASNMFVCYLLHLI